MSWRSPEPCRHGSTAPHPRRSDPEARRQTLCDFDRCGVARSELHDATRASLVSAFPGELARGRELRHDRANSDRIWRHGVSWATHCPPSGRGRFWCAGRLPPPRTSSVAVPGASHGGGRWRRHQRRELDQRNARGRPSRSSTRSAYTSRTGAKPFVPCTGSSRASGGDRQPC
jgi:hypothetical protein